MTGKIAWLNEKTGHGEIESSDRFVYFRYTDFVFPRSEIIPGLRVEFDLIDVNDYGHVAKNIRVIKGEP